VQLDSSGLGRLGRSGSCNSGFTLIEVLLVIVIMAVMTAMVAPSFFSAASPSLKDQARRLSQALRLAIDESTLTGMPIRWTAYRHRYVFESPDAEGAWQARDDAPYNAYPLPEGMLIAAIDPPALPEAAQAQDRRKNSDKEPVLAHLIFPPQGVMAAADITLAYEDDATSSLHILIRPGPGGVRVSEQAAP